MKLVALVDGSVYSQSVCDYAAWATLLEGGNLDLLHVLDDRNNEVSNANLSGNIGFGARTALMEELAELDARRAKLAQKKGRAILEDAEARVGEVGVSLVESKLRHGDLVETVLNFEKDADLLVVGKRGEAANFAKMHLGSNLERVVRAAQKPVLVVSRKFEEPTNLLIAYDGGASSQKAIDSVCSHKMYGGLNCHILSVGSSENIELANKQEEAVAKLQAAGFKVTCEMRAGQAATVIQEACERQNTDLLVMGAYGHSRIRNLIIGSTTTEVIRKCLISLVLYR